MNDLLDALAAAVVEVYPPYRWRAQLRDPDDDMVLEAAINGRAMRSSMEEISALFSSALMFACCVREMRWPVWKMKEIMKKSNLATPLEPPPSLAETRPQKSIRKRARRADRRKGLSILKQAGKGNAPLPGDEVVKP
jgi:hypothetical protein